MKKRSAWRLWLASWAFALVIGPGCDRSDSQPSPPPAATPRAAPAHADAALSPGGDLRWLTRLPAVPGVPVLQSLGGPLVAGEVVVVASSVIGFVGVDRASGAIRWHRPGEERPWTPALIGEQLALPGRCSHRAADAPRRAVACVDRVDPKTGAVQTSSWVRAPREVSRARPIGVTDIGFIWAGDGVVWRDGGAALEVLERRGATHHALSAHIKGDAITIVWRDRLSVRAVQSKGPMQTYDLGEASIRGVAGPVTVADRLAVVRDDSLLWWTTADGEAATSPSARLSFAKGSLRGGESLGAIGLEAGVHALRIDPVSGAIRRTAAVPGIQAHEAVWLSNTQVVVASRRDVSLVRDDVTAFDDKGPRWTWPVPVPADGRRLDPIGLAVDQDAVFVFIDGRQLARLVR